jgi:Domain of unknown function (DUF4157)
LMGRYFPGLDLNEVEFCLDSTLPANWFAPPGDVAAMTFGYRIYFKGSGIQDSQAGLKLLMHELVHADQVRRRGGEVSFACHYGRGYLEAGGYRSNPMEAEAYAFVVKHGPSLPDGVA